MKKHLVLTMLLATTISIAASHSVPTIDIHKIKPAQALTGPYSFFVPPYSYYYFHHMDQLDFKFDWVRRAGNIYPLKEPTSNFTTSYIYNNHTYTLDQYMQRNAVTGFLVLKDNQIIYERYFHGADQQSRFLSNSVGKSITSTLVGIALTEGKLGSLDDTIIKYLPELKDSGYNRVTLKQALEMATGVDLTYTPYDPHSSTHLFNKASLTGNPSFMKLLKSIKANKNVKPGTIFDYENENTEALGLALEKAVGKPLSEYMQEKIWEKIGAQSDAFLYRAKTQPNECAFGCMSATVRDYGRFGLMMMNGGSLNGTQIVNADWIKAATTPANYTKPVEADGKLGYGYQWWIPKSNDQAFEAMGIFGQILYVNPAKHIVIVETASWDKPETDKKWDEAAKAINSIVEKLS